MTTNTNRRRMTGRTLLVGIAAATVCSMSGLAGAQVKDAPAKDDGQTLRGPLVQPQEERGPGRLNQRAPRGDAMEAQEREIPFATVLVMARRLAGDRMEDGLRLTEGQGEKIRTIANAHAKELNAHMTKHRKDLRAHFVAGGFDRAVELIDKDEIDARAITEAFQGAQRQGEMRQGEMRQNRAGGAEGERAPRNPRAPRGEGDSAAERPAPAARMTPERMEAMRGVREIMSKGPSAEIYTKQVMEVLNSQQQSWMKERMEEMRSRQGQGQGQGQGQMRERLESMSPAERERMMQEMRERREGAQRPRRQQV